MFSRWRLICLSTAALLCTAVLTGCGEQPSETLPGHQVKGKVTINGKEPGTYANVEFVSVSNASETGSAGFDPGGNLSGRVPLGKCKVFIKVGSSGGPPGGGGGFPKGGGPGGAGFPKGGGPTGPPGGSGGGSGGPPLSKGAEIPRKFMDVKTSGIEVDVVNGQDVNIDFK